MEGGNRMSVNRIGRYAFASIGEMCRYLVSEQVEVHPSCRLATTPRTDDIGHDDTRFSKITWRKSKMGGLHGPHTYSVGGAR